MAINKVVYGANTLIDITDTTATTDTVLNGYDFYDASGVKRTGTATGASAINIYQDQDGYVVLDDDPGSAVAITPLSVTSNGTYTAPTGKAYSPVTVNVAGGGGGSISDQVRFFDYDGTLVNSYSASDFNALTAMPSNPSHTGLVAQGWNWSLADAKAYLASCPDGILNIGQMYTTDTGDTRLYIHIDEDTPDNRLTFYVRFTSSTANNVTLDWGDGTVETKGSTSAAAYPHTYATGGDYVIKLTVNTGTISFVGSSGTSGNSIYGSRSTTYSYNRGRIRKAEIGNKVTSIGAYAFYYCYSLTSITIPSTVTSIGAYAFYSCSSLTSITIPSSVTSIGAYALQNCHSITSITIPSGVTSISNSAFYYCYSLTSITIPSTVTSIGDYAFSTCYSLTSITIPSTVTSIGAYAFSTCYSIASITIPSGVTSIGNNAFQSCYSLTSITIPSNVTSIGNNAFQGCSSITSITIPSNVTSIGNATFQGCYSLTSLSIPDGVTSIGTSVFQNCYGMSEYHFLPTTPPTLANTNAFTSIPSDCKIYVPYSADHSILEAYQTETNWSTYASYMVEESA